MHYQFSNLKQTPLSTELAKFFMSMSICETGDELNDYFETIMNGFEDYPIYCAIKSYCSNKDSNLLKMSKYTQVYLSALILEGGGRFGWVDIYLAAISEYIETHTVSEFTMHDFTNLMPFGYLTEDTLDAAWDSFKKFYNRK